MGSSLVPIMLIVVLLVGAVVFVVLSSRAPRTGADAGRRRTLETRRSRPGAIPLREQPSPEPPGEPSGPDATDDPDGMVPGFSAPAAAAVPVAGGPVAGGPATPSYNAAETTGGEDAADSGEATRSAWDDATGWNEWVDTDATRVSSLNEPDLGDETDTATTTADDRQDAGHNIGGVYPPHATGGFDSGSRDTYMNDSRDPDATGWTPPPSGRPHHSDVDDSAYRLSTAQEGRGPATGGFPIPEPPTHAGYSDAGYSDAGHPGSSGPGYPGPASYPDPAAAQTRRVPVSPEHAPSWGSSHAPVPPAPPLLPPLQAQAQAEGTSPESGEAGIVAAEPAQTTTPALRLAAAGRSRRGKRGGPNEDAWVVSDGLLAVADGVGGEAAGQIASTLAVTTVAGFRPQYARDPVDGLRQAIARANQVVREKPREEPAWRGMACTLDVVILGRQQSTGETLFIAHVGDSSVWLQPQKGRPHQITTPHAIKNGPLLNAIGLADQIEADLLHEPVRAGDRVILASDGITKVMTPEQLLGLMTELGAEPPEKAADALVEAALIAGARDDTTIVVADLVSEPSSR
ncbi:serine/threonine protein phosphatase [Frankia sp. CcI49]|uniref:PP2C family protein-serine/threonine phosphatase n=1 Tax=Frankia sp. CcI49 TaxID=1745382 RepID=UPI00097748D7|nr:PP2C family serine/threonine-protein phosphatase [Frankia sp. CcI49]ONH58503.1 serine/threonine protein phosphatase [Frankia sp. CcI49]